MLWNRNTQCLGNYAMCMKLSEDYDAFRLQGRACTTITANTLHIIVLLGHGGNHCTANLHA